MLVVVCAGFLIRSLFMLYFIVLLHDEFGGIQSLLIWFYVMLQMITKVFFNMLFLHYLK